MKELRGCVAVVTGGASGIGRGMAEAFLDAGMKVVIGDVEAPALETAVEEMSGSGEVAGFVCDVADQASVDTLAQQTLDRFGAAHVLCNNAGVGGSAGTPLWETPLDEYDWVLGVNVMGIVHGIRSFVPILLEQAQGGHVVNTASMAGLIPGGGIYGISKHSAVALSESMFSQLAMAGGKVGVSVLCPGWVSTRIMESDRNKPESPRPNAGADAQQFEAMREMVAGLVRGGLAPRKVGDIVVDAIQSRRFYVLTHPWEKMIEQRMQNILQGRDPVGQPPPGMQIPGMPPPAE